MKASERALRKRAKQHLRNARKIERDAHKSWNEGRVPFLAYEELLGLARDEVERGVALLEYLERRKDER